MDQSVLTMDQSSDHGSDDTHRLKLDNPCAEGRIPFSQTLLV